MNDIRFEGAHVAIVDQNLSMRRLMRSSLHSIGFDQITECRNITELVDFLGEEDVDLLLLDLDTETERICHVIKKIRAGDVGSNPFLVIIALTWLPEKDVVHLTLTSGTDDVVTKPVSAKVLMERIGNLVENRKEFVVTTTYIGPERRSKPRVGGGDLPTIKAPNTLRARAIGDESVRKVRSEIVATMRQVNIHKVYRLANLIGTKTVILLERTAKYRNTPVPRDRLHELSDLIATLRQRVANDEMQDYAGITASMANVMDQILDTVIPTPRQLEILRVHSQAVSAAIVGDDTAAELVTKALKSASELVNKQSLEIEQAG